MSRGELYYSLSHMHKLLYILCLALVASLSGAGFAAAEDSNAPLLQIYRSSAAADKRYPEVARAVALLPERVTTTLRSAGVKILIVPSLLEYDSSLGQKGAPRGWESGSSFENVGGLYHVKTNAVLVAERAVPLHGGGAAQPTEHRFRTVLHETGHAFDSCLGHISRAADFRAAYTLDVDNLTSNQRQKLRYFLQSGNAGPAETFATVFANAVCQSGNTPLVRPDLAEAFPRASEQGMKLIR
ncbi:MAG: hypothetical protein JST01_27995 [Cyanobacteria bacterium SZAS TMP-1]|nr:hypothetical protein [Cyanobacteria bacterium SZAS TMP-1]